MASYALKIALLLSLRSFAGVWFDHVLKHSDWPTYQACLSHYQKARPGVFPPLELVRFDLLPLDEVKHQVSKHATIWKDSLAKPDLSQRKAELLKSSQEANRELYNLFNRELQKQGSKIQGTTRAILESLNNDLRSFLTPLDKNFQLNEVGKKISSLIDPEKKNLWSAFSYDEKNKILYFEGKDAGKYQAVRILQKPNNEGWVVLKAENKIRSLSSVENAQYRPDFQNGSFFGYQKSSPYPFGPFIKDQDLFSGENGQLHYGGDGHKHDGHNHKH